MDVRSRPGLNIVNIDFGRSGDWAFILTVMAAYSDEDLLFAKLAKFLGQK